MRIVLYVEGDTEKAIRPALKAFLDGVADQESRPKVRLVPRREAQILKTKVISRNVARDLDDPETLGVALLVDVRPTFRSAAAAKAHYSGCGDAARFRAHCALHDFEAWLLPYWERVYRLAGKPAPKAPKWPSPENVDLQKPPSRVLREDVFTGRPGYTKTIHAPAILKGQDLRVAADACPELEAFLNTLLEFAGLETRL